MVVLLLAGRTTAHQYANVYTVDLLEYTCTCPVSILQVPLCVHAGKRCATLECPELLSLGEQQGLSLLVGRVPPPCCILVCSTDASDGGALSRHRQYLFEPLTIYHGAFVI